jgi:serine protease Do
MANFDINEFDENIVPPRPTTPPVRRGFLVILAWLSFLVILVYGIPYVADQTGYAWESGRSRAAVETLAKLEKSGVIDRSSALFRMANAAVAPAVVNIRTSRTDVEAAAQVDPRARGFVPQISGLGSGVVIDKDRGFIVTNHHVVKDAEQIVVRVGGRNEVDARLVGADPKTDLAVIQIQGPLRSQAEWGDSDKLDIGDWVLAIGSPFALDHTVTAGIISATGRRNLALPDLGEDGYQDFLQTDAAINPGNSGGPLVDLTGKVVGINTAIYSESGGYQGIGLAIPSSMAHRIVDQLISNGKVIRGYLGVTISNVSPELAKKSGLAEPRGAVILSVQPGGPAERSGLKAGDIVLKLGDREIGDISTLRNRTAELPLGKSVEVRYLREGKEKKAEVTIAELPSSPVMAAFGFQLRELPAAEALKQANKKANDRRATRVVVSKVESGGFADRAGLKVGMRIVGVGYRPIRTLAEFEETTARANWFQGLPLRVLLADGTPGFVVIQSPEAAGK